MPPALTPSKSVSTPLLPIAGSDSGSTSGSWPDHILGGTGRLQAAAHRHVRELNAA